jgi:hypothetical protein
MRCAAEPYTQLPELWAVEPAELSSLIDETEARCRSPVVHEVSAELARLRGDERSRQSELREAHRLFVEMGATGHAERIAPLLAESRS